MSKERIEALRTMHKATKAMVDTLYEQATDADVYAEQQLFSEISFFFGFINKKVSSLPDGAQKENIKRMMATNEAQFNKHLSPASLQFDA